MDFFKGIFGEEEKKSPVGAQQKTARVIGASHPPRGITASAAAPAAASPSVKPVTAPQPAAPVPASPSTATVNPPSAFGLFDGMEIKSAEPAPAAAGFDMFSGLSLAPAAGTEGTAASAFGFLSDTTSATDSSSMDQAPPADASASASAFSFLSGDAPVADSAPASMFADLDLKAAPETAPETSMFDLAGLVVRSPPVQMDAAPSAAPSFDFMMGSRSRGASVAASAPSPVPAVLPAVSEAKPSGLPVGLPMGLPAMAPLPVSNDDDDILAAALTKAAERTVEAQVGSIRYQIKESMRQYWLAMKGISVQLNEAKSTCNTQKSLCSTLLDERSSTEAAQARAVENEEFENADALNQRIESLSAQFNAAQQQQRLAEAAVVRLQSEQVALSTKLQRDLNEFNAELRKHQQHQQGQLGRYQDEQNHKISEQEDRLNAEVDRIQRSLSHTEKDIALVEDEQKSIDDGIYERTKETQEEKQVLITQKQEIQGKIDELMLQVRALQSELDTCEGSLRAVETKINVTRTSYEKPLRRIHEKRVRILAEKAEAETEMAACDSQKLVLEGARRDMEAQVTKFNTLLTEIASDVDGNQEMVKRLEANISSANGASSDEVDPSARAMSDLQQQLVLNDENIKQCDESTAAVRRQVADLQQEILSIDAKSPALEAEKKAAVAAKNYKEAGRVTNDLKSFAQRKIDCGVEIEALTARDESLQAERRTLIQSKQQIQASLEDAQVQFDLHQLRSSVTKRASLKQLSEAAAAQARFEESEWLAFEIQRFDSEISVLQRAHANHSEFSDAAIASLQSSVEVVKSQIEVQTLAEPVDELVSTSAETETPAVEVVEEVVAEALPVAEAVPEPAESAQELQDKLSTWQAELDEAAAAQVAAESDLNSKAAELSELEVKLEAAIASDDFETADQLNESIASIKADHESLSASVQSLTDKLKALQTQIDACNAQLSALNSDVADQ